MNWKSFTRDYLDFTRKDRVGIIVILVIMLMLLVIPGLLQHYTGNNQVNTDTSWIAAVRRLELQENDTLRRYQEFDRSFERKRGQPFKNYEVSGGELFYFDPNSLSLEGWKKLGVREKTIQTIQNYLRKGGRFNRAEDLQRIYGLSPELYEKIFPFIQIDKKENQARFFPENPLRQKHADNYTIIDINSADTSAYISLPGIGSKLAARIVNFREKLGGFYLIEQVAETFGLPDSTFQKIKPFLKLENAAIRKININTATVEELRSHPYIRYSIANPVVAYRNEHGKFLKIEDIKNVMVVTDEVYIKIAPYLTINN